MYKNKWLAFQRLQQSGINCTEMMEMISHAHFFLISEETAMAGLKGEVL